MSQLPSFERLALPYMDDAFNLAFWIMRNQVDADDTVQESYLRAFHGLAGPNFKPWLLAIVRNVAFQWQSNRRRSGNVISMDEAIVGRLGEGVAEAQIASDESTPEVQLLGKIDRYLVRMALEEPTPIIREVLVLREIEGLAYREIAEVAGAPDTVKSRLARGRIELRKTLTRLMEKDEPHVTWPREGADHPPCWHPRWRGPQSCRWS
jgi:RNA polymerase sigma-70 factor, ECF subfamily